MKGKIKTLKISYGFIEYEEEGNKKDIFFHQTEVEGGENNFKTLKLGNTVEFEIGKGENNKTQAKNVKKTE